MFLNSNNFLPFLMNATNKLFCKAVMCLFLAVLTEISGIAWTCVTRILASFHEHLSPEQLLEINTDNSCVLSFLTLLFSRCGLILAVITDHK